MYELIRPSLDQLSLQSGLRREIEVLKWLIVFALAMSLIGWFTPLLRRFGLGRLPGDIRFVRNGREYSFPFASSLLLSALMTWLFYLMR
jgi:hypothetical protein